MRLNKRYNLFLDAIQQGLIHCVADYMPSSAYRSFALWLLSTALPYHSEWLQVIGAAQIARLSLGLFDGLVDNANWLQLAYVCQPLNTYFVFEAMSDDLAINLVGYLETDLKASERGRLLEQFNVLMMARLNGDSKPAHKLLAPLRVESDLISSFAQSLSFEKHTSLSQIYCAQMNRQDAPEIEFSMWPRLIANMESCMDVVRYSAGFPAGSLILQGLNSRYDGVNSLVNYERMSPARQARVGADTILCIPTLAYYISALNAVQPIRNFETVINEGLLEETLYCAALLTRLLNDLGSLVTQTGIERDELMRSLRSYAVQHPTMTVIEVLHQNATHGMGTILSRIYKDIRFGEFNMGLYHLVEIGATQAALDIFEQRLTYFCLLYTQTHEHLMLSLDTINAVVSTNSISRIIERFIQFHQLLYANPHDNQAGDYTV